MDALLKALQNTLIEQDLLLYGVVYGFIPLVVFSHIQYRKKHSKKDIPDGYLRTLACTMAGVMAWLATYFAFNLTAGQATMHAIAVGLSFPLILTVIFVVMRKRWPKAYEKIRQRRVTIDPLSMADIVVEDEDDEKFLGSGSWWR